jgi:hypothetical protein
MGARGGGGYVTCYKTLGYLACYVPLGTCNMGGAKHDKVKKKKTGQRADWGEIFLQQYFCARYVTTMRKCSVRGQNEPTCCPARPDRTDGEWIGNTFPLGSKALGETWLHPIFPQLAGLSVNTMS